MNRNPFEIESVVAGETLLVRVETAAKMCEISRSRAYELIASGDLPSICIGRSRRVPVEALLDWINQKLIVKPDVEGN